MRNYTSKDFEEGEDKSTLDAENFDDKKKYSENQEDKSIQDRID